MNDLNYSFICHQSYINMYHCLDTKCVNHSTDKTLSQIHQRDFRKLWKVWKMQVRQNTGPEHETAHLAISSHATNIIGIRFGHWQGTTMNSEFNFSKKLQVHCLAYLSLSWVAYCHSTTKWDPLLIFECTLPAVNALLTCSSHI